MSTDDKHREYEEVADLMNVVGQKIHEQSHEILFRGFEDSRVFNIFEYVYRYWKDKFRPTLISLSCDAVGGNPEDTYPFGIMMSILGSGIGIHDDIIDNTKIKHFKTTIFGQYGQDLGIITGDLLIIRSLTYFRDILNMGYENNVLFQILEAYEDFTSEMWFGEIMEIDYRKNLEVDLDEYHESLWKLGVDAEACTRIGAIIGKGNKNEIESLAKYGRHLGYLNRLLDEVRDMINLEGNLAHRIQNESIPLPLLYSAKKSRKNYKQIEKIINKSKITESEIKVLLEICFDSNAFTYIQKIANTITNNAYQILENIKQSKAKQYLKLILWGLNSDIQLFNRKNECLPST